MADFAAARASALRETMITLQPSPAKISAAARPIPFEPPVIKAVLPASFKSMLSHPASRCNYERDAIARQPAPLTRRFDHSANAFAMTYLGAKSEIAFRGLSIHRTSRSNRLAIVNLESHRFASRRSSVCNVLGRYFFRMRNEVDELPATFGKAG